MNLLRVLAIALTFTAPVVLAAPPVPGSDDAETMKPHENWIVSQHSPSGKYCCNLGDGRPAELRELTAGHYEVFYSKEHWTDGTNQWIPVPQEAILTQQSPMYVPIAWIVLGHVYCVALAGAS